jgi:poly(3-hydroxybutyrate) depolymerase
MNFPVGRGAGFVARLLPVLFAVMMQWAHAASAALPAFRIDLAQTSVSGLSSGAYMAVQFAVAHSSMVRGIGIVAGGPYYCARGNVGTATTVCSCTGLPVIFVCQVAPGATRIDDLIRVTDFNASARTIDPTSHLAGMKVWMFSGTKDTIVPQAVMNDLYGYLSHYMPQARIRYRHDVAAEHAMPTDGYGNGCGQLAEPFLSNCHLDAAGEMLQWIYDGTLQPRSDGPPAGRFIEFDQAEFLPDRQPQAHGLAATGFAYVPAACDAAGAVCRLHVAFHGCRQNVASVGRRFIEHAGYNRWADTNRMIVLYPQTAATANNPKACWDWFDAEHDDPSYETKKGIQVSAVRHMVDRIAGVPSAPPGATEPACFTSSNFDHVRFGRAHLDFFLWARANGSNAGLGFADAFSKTTLKRTAPNYYVIGTCP